MPRLNALEAHTGILDHGGDLHNTRCSELTGSAVPRSGLCAIRLGLDHATSILFFSYSYPSLWSGVVFLPSIHYVIEEPINRLTTAYCG